MSGRHLVPRSAFPLRPVAPATEQLYEALGISTNAEPSSCAVCVLDASLSMGFPVEIPDMPPFRPIDKLNEALHLLPEYINADEIMAQYSAIALVKCAGHVTLAQDFVPAGSFRAPTFHANGRTPLAKALNFAADCIEEFEQKLIAQDRDVCRPFVFTITDACLTDSDDMIARVGHRIRALEDQKRVA